VSQSRTIDPKRTEISDCDLLPPCRVLLWYGDSRDKVEQRYSNLCTSLNYHQ
jgi:hypothetical protein